MTENTSNVSDDEGQPSSSETALRDVPSGAATPSTSTTTGEGADSAMAQLIEREKKTHSDFADPR